YQQLVGDERGGQAVVVLAGARRAVTGRIHHQHVGVLAAQPEKELLEQFFVAAHGDAGADKRVDLLAFDVACADAVDAPAPVQYPRAILDEVYRGGDVGGDAGVGVALDDHLEAAPGIFQGAEKTAVFGVFVTGRKDGGD